MFGFGRKGKADMSRLNAVYVSEIGLVRTENQDNVLFSIGHGIFCVADGVGDCLDGARASASVCHELKLRMTAVGHDFAARVESVRQGLADINEMLYALSNGEDSRRLGSTAAVIVFDLTDLSRAAIVHAGDSRVYRIRRGLATCLTRDHRRIGSNMLTRAVGAAPVLQCDVKEIDVLPGDRFVVCSDGVSSVVSAGRLALHASGRTLESSAERLADEVVKGGAPDNFTFILVEA